LPVLKRQQNKENEMRFLVAVKANKDSEAGVMPSREMLEEMGKFNEELVKAGVLLAAEGLEASSKGVRARYGRQGVTFTDGPFAETKELIAGFWLWQVRSKEEALEWLRRCPMGEGAEIELRRVFEPADFEPHATPELLAKEAELRSRVEGKK
jgi:hypothetical protein